MRLIRVQAYLTKIHGKLYFEFFVENSSSSQYESDPKKIKKTQILTNR